MPIKKIYKCCICHKELDTKPHRLVHQEYALKGYGYFKDKHRFDFCDNCFKRFKYWIYKHKEAKDESHK